MPATISANPTAMPVSRPSNAITQKARRNGRVATNQVAASSASTARPHDHAPFGPWAVGRIRPRAAFGPGPWDAASRRPRPTIGRPGSFGLCRTGLASFERPGKLRAGRWAPRLGRTVPEDIRRREPSLCGMMDYCGRPGFDKSESMMAWAQAGRPRPCVNSSSSSSWSAPRFSAVPSSTAPGCAGSQTQLLGSLGLGQEGEIASVDLKGGASPDGDDQLRGPVAPVPAVIADAGAGRLRAPADPAGRVAGRGRPACSGRRPRYRRRL